MSLGVRIASNITYQQYYGHYKEDDVLIIAAAGNGGNSDYLYPASYDPVMSVAAVNSQELKASLGKLNGLLFWNEFTLNFKFNFQISNWCEWNKLFVCYNKSHTHPVGLFRSLSC